MKRVLTFSVLFANLFANTINIPADYSIIQAGINAAEPGDTVLVEEGIYYENLQINKEITLGSYFLLDGDLSHRDATIIDGSSYNENSSPFGSCVLFLPSDNGEAISAKLTGFTIQNGQGTRVRETTDDGVITYYMGGGLMIWYTIPEITFNYIRDNGGAPDSTRAGKSQKGGGGALNNHIDVEFDEDRNGPSNRTVLTRDDEIIFSNNIFENNDSETGNTFESIGYVGEVDFSDSFFDVFSTEYEDVSEYWVVNDEATTDFTGGSGDLEAITHDVWVSPDGTDVSSTFGTEQDPFRTIDYALSRIYPTASDAITINLTEGVFSPSTTGEAFPIIMISYVNLIGQSEELTILDAEQTNTVIYFNKCIYNNISDLTITGGNSSNGGGIFMNASNPTLMHVTISENTAGENGGGMFITLSIPDLSHVMITENNSIIGGGIFLDKFSTANLNYVIISDNNADEGAGIYLTANSDPNLTHVMIVKNSSNFSGGGMYIGDNSSPILMHVTISENSAANGGGLFLENSDIGLVNPVLTNSIIWDNIPGSIYLLTGNEEPIISYSDIEGGWEGEGNIESNPLFTDPENTDYTLMDGSPCIDSGDPNIWYSDIDGTRADMGATGGLYAIPNFIYYDFGEVGDIGSDKQFTLYNYRQTPITIDSVNFNTFSFISNTSFPIIIEPLQTGNINIEVNNSSYEFVQDEMELVSEDLPEGISVSLSVTGTEGNVLTGNLSGTYPVSTYRITGNITIENGDIVILEPGTQFLFDGGYSFTVFGVLSAIGTETDSIIFDNYGMDNNWKGFSLEGVTNETKFEYVRISGGEKNIIDPAGGGGLRLYLSDPIFNHVTISGNHAYGFSNMSTGSGGGMYLFESNPILNYVIIHGNYAMVRGGGIGLYSSSPTLNHVTISENNGVIGGGGIYITADSNPILNHVTISDNNSAEGWGGGLTSFSSNPIITHTTITGNNALYSGGGISLSDSSNLTLTNVTISGNTAHWGGGMWVYAAGVIITNSNIWDNSAFFAGGIGSKYSNITLTNVTISENTCDCSNSDWMECPDDGCGGGIFVDGGYYELNGEIIVGSAVLSNSIIWDNSPESIYYYELNNDGCTDCEVTTLNYSDVEGGWEGEGNIDSDPLFTDPENGDFNLQEGSPCIDTGTADLDGDGVEDITDYIGLAPDMGAFEYGALSIGDNTKIVPEFFTLHQNYPNPFNPITTLKYNLPEQTQVTLTVYDMLGRQVTQLVNTTQEAGYRSVQWNATNFFGKPVSAGVYLYQIRAGEFVQTRKMVLLK